MELKGSLPCLQEPAAGTLFCPVNFLYTYLPYGFNIRFNVIQGRAVARAGICQLLTAVRVQSHAGPCGICGGKSDNGTWFSSTALPLPRLYHSTTAGLSFFHLSPITFDFSC
jgi:hypothetical protein